MLVHGSTALKIQNIELNNENSVQPVEREQKNYDAIGVSALPADKYSIPQKLTEQAIEKVNKAITNSDRRLEYKIHEATRQLMVKVVNKDTGEIVREIPSEKILDMVASMCKTAGILVDEKR